MFDCMNTHGPGHSRQQLDSKWPRIPCGVLRKTHTSITRSRVSYGRGSLGFPIELSRLRCRVLYLACLRFRSGLPIFYEFLTSPFPARPPQ
jgi:hypothetical protein